MILHTVGSGQVIKGWEVGLEGMCLGEKRTLIIPPDMAYGKLLYFAIKIR